MPRQKEPDPGDPDTDRVKLPLDPVETLKALLKVDPDSEPVDDADDPEDE
ncbi:MAG: hypothetical protein GY700_11235 [Propionibacteriaceae bacterium]|nr:hypothetical protein [Propionibacteriaceae bacterium]